MQKIFIKYTFIIMTAAIFLILSINFLLSLHTLKVRQFDTFYAKIEQVIHTLENNQEELQLLKESLDEDYLTRAKAAAYVMDRQQEVSMDVSEMQYLADLLNVDELHVIDENGIIVSASVSKYVGIDMDDHEQTRAFLALLDSDDEDAYLIQDAQPNAAENKIMQYIGVARKSQKGIVQVGFTPTRQLNAQSRNTYDYIFSKFPTDIGEELFVADAATGDVLGHSGGLGQSFDNECYQLDELLECTKGAFKKGGGASMYVVCRPYEDVLLCAALPKNTLLQKLWGNTLATFLYLMFIEAAVILLLNYLVKRQVIRGIHDIIGDLDSITNGNLDTTVTVGGNREFEELGKGINTMVKKMQYENTHDPLTGLYKFEPFKELAAEILRKIPCRKVCALVMIDLDYFKSINDTYGHDMGDRYLQGFASVLSSMPKEHFLSARRSGDEFCMMIHDCGNASEIRQHLDMFYAALKKHSIQLSDTQTKVISASSGFAWTDSATDSIAGLLSNADAALYAVKKNTKGCYAEYRQ